MEIEIKDIRKRYGKREILKGVSFSASGGECIGILGGNGCGKSTLLSILAGVLRADGGNFFFRQPAEAPSVPPDGASGGNSTNIGNGRNTENGANAGNGRNTENGANAGNGRNTGNGINIDLLRTPKRRAALVGYVPQGTPLIEELSALDNLLMWYDRQTLQSELPECFPRRRAAGAARLPPHPGTASFRGSGSANFCAFRCGSCPAG